jgi:hypothetical protein
MILELLDRIHERELRKLLRILTRKSGIFFIRLFRMAGCQAESKAALMPRKAQQEDIFFFLLFSIRLIREREMRFR